jgi:hypothetical protein
MEKAVEKLLGTIDAAPTEDLEDTDQLNRIGAKTLLPDRSGASHGGWY